MGSGTTNWGSWCDERAVSTAVEVASLIKTHYTLPVSIPNRSETSETNCLTAAQANDLVARFVEVFARRLESEVLAKGISSVDATVQSTLYDFPSDTSAASAYSQRNGGAANSETHAVNGESDNQNKSLTSPNDEQAPARSIPSSSSESEQPPLTQQQKPTPSSRKPFYRRLSFKGFRKGRFFHKQYSDEAKQGSYEPRSRQDTSSKAKLAKILVECQKEGTVHYLSGENLDGTQKWEKCRLCLVKTVGGYMLEFYSPPKAVKPKSGVFCFLITEARETTALEMPDCENTFVLKAENNMEYVIEAYDTEEMKSWLTIIKYSMRALVENGDGSSHNNNGSLSENGSGNDGQTNHLSHTNTTSPPQLPPRFAIRSVNEDQVEDDTATTPTNVYANHDTSANEETRAENAAEAPRDIYTTLQEYPWFHGTLSRSEAARLVLQEEAEGHGTFLVRQSETRIGEFVLTFNFQGKAKHLRITLSQEGQCRVQHLWFQSVFDMLEHFRLQPIPLESGGTSDVTLTEFVVALPSLRGLSQLHSPNNSERARPPVVPELQMVVTHSGSVRTRTESMERHHREQTSGGSSRAIENTYSFV